MPARSGSDVYTRSQKEGPVEFQTRLVKRLLPMPRRLARMYRYFRGQELAELHPLPARQAHERCRCSQPGVPPWVRCRWLAGPSPRMLAYLP